ncbi:hypothetical protein OIU84_014317 [Salix udensis]|uniref:Uncharacterized protein n=1 Tax=Salix udensis TaxID=889485 RepID=A0AAD6JCP9_9ROSI|nr:hypothetical protein OIU84_014317 [Salix udensis]
MDEPLFLRLCFISDLKSRLSPVCVKGFRKTNTLYVIELKGGGLNWVYCIVLNRFPFFSSLQSMLRLCPISW